MKKYNIINEKTSLLLDKKGATKIMNLVGKDSKLWNESRQFLLSILDNNDFEYDLLKYKIK